jgi:copper oxidase (laccase) domain-containing protein
VGPEFRRAFLDESEAHARFFDAAENGKFRFDLPAFVADRAAVAGVQSIGLIAADTCADSEIFFSYRRTTLEGGTSYGRALAVVALAG